jgi:hypothetical protein
MHLRLRSRLAALVSLVFAFGFAGAPHAQAAGAVDLAALRDTLAAQAPRGSAAYLDPISGHVVLKLAGEPSAQLKAQIAKHPGLVQTRHTAPIVPYLALYGGHGMTAQSGGAGCTTGFIATYNGANYVITAGHCLALSRFWDRKNNYLGERESWSFGLDGDYGLLKVKGVHMSPAGLINLNAGPRPVAGVLPYVWWQEFLCFMGNESRQQCGNVTATEVTVPYDFGFNTVEGLIETTICAQHGDSGGPLFLDTPDGLYGMGILSGGTNFPCGHPDYRSYFQPLQEILDTYPGLALRLGV